MCQCAVAYSDDELGPNPHDELGPNPYDELGSNPHDELGPNPHDELDPNPYDDEDCFEVSEVSYYNEFLGHYVTTLDPFQEWVYDQSESASAQLVQWWPEQVLPPAASLLWGDPELYASLCDFCQSMQNIEYNDDGRMTRVICDSCCTIVGRYELNHCTGGYDACEKFRFVDPLGNVSHLCRGCHQHEEGQRRRRRRRNGQRNRRGHRAEHRAVAGH